MEQWPDVFCSFAQFTRSKLQLCFVSKNYVFLAVVLLNHVYHALHKGLSTQGVWHCACAYALLSRD